MENTEKKLLMDSADVAENVEKLVSMILNEFSAGELPNVAFIGIQSAGVPLARRIVRGIREKTSVDCPAGLLDISMYRDDIGTRKMLPAIRETNIPFDVNGMVIVLTDAVIQTGRSIRAALDAIVGYGRPAKIRLAVLVDRGMREYPISPDYTAVELEASSGSRINVEWHECNETDAVYEEPRRME